MKKSIRIVSAFVITATALVVLFLIAINAGSIKVSIGQIMSGLFSEYDKDVAIIYDLRFPRIFISILAGAGIAVSGVLLQAVLKNPLADAGIIGISSGASFFTLLAISFFPTMTLVTPALAFCGGSIAFLIVYSISWQGGAKPIRIILVGVAVGAMFEGLIKMLSYMSGQKASQVMAIVDGNISVKNWSDVHILAGGVSIGLVAALVIAGRCNLLSLEEKTIMGLGIRTNIVRLYISVIAIGLVCVCAAITGGISFLGLIVPHLGRLIVGKNHKVLIPYTIILGAVVYLAADTLGRTLAYPYEIPAAVIMAVIGGPGFIILLKRSQVL